jgi:hypothetical protein
MMLWSLYGLVCYGDSIVHFDGFNSARSRGRELKALAHTS